jgi:integrase
MPAINEKSVKAHTARLRKQDGKPVDAFLWDDEQIGFGCKATPAGKRVFFVQYRPRGGGQNIKRYTIGYYGKLTVAQARAEARRLLGEASAGQDPRAKQVKARNAELAEKAERAKEKAAGTLQEAIERFLTVHSKSTRYWHEKRQRMLSADLKALHSKPIRTITHAHIEEALETVKRRNVSAHRLLFADLRPFFKWAKKRIPLEANPMADADAPAPAKKRERVLEDHEVIAFWQAAGSMEWPFFSVYKLLLLTGARREEVAAMRWAELDFDKSVWALPSQEDFLFKRQRRDKTELHEGRTKNARAHRVPLPFMAVALLNRDTIDKAKAERGYPLDSDLVFSTTGGTPPSGFSKAKHQLDLRMAELLGSKWDEKAGGFVGGKFKPWRLHDLRRTCATGMENLGIDTRVVETALNHVSGTKAGIVGVYQRAEHREAVKAAFEAWGQYVARLTDDKPLSNVLRFRTAT